MIYKKSKFKKSNFKCKIFNFGAIPFGPSKKIDNELKLDNSSILIFDSIAFRNSFIFNSNVNLLNKILLNFLMIFIY